MKKTTETTERHPLYKLQRVLGGHSEPINSIAWSPDGSKLASASADTKILIWDITTSGIINSLEGHEAPVTSVAWSPDGQWLVSSSADKTLRFWNSTRDRAIKTAKGYKPTSVAWSPDGKRIASGTLDNNILIWEGQGGAPIVLRGHQGTVNTVAWSPDGKRIASGSDDTTIILWDMRNYLPIQQIEGHNDRINSLVWSPDGNLFVSGSNDRTIIAWDSQSGRRRHILEGHTDSVGCINFSPDGNFCASRSKDNSVRLWRVGNWIEIANISESVLSSGESLTTQFNPKFQTSPLLATLGAKQGIAQMTILIWVLDRSQLLTRVPIAESRIYRNAKIALVGDTGVGKTGLGLVLSGQKWQPTESTHGRHVWILDKQGLRASRTKNVTEEREILLWDLAGQPGYRLIHRLHLHDVTVAAVLFDARSETDPFAGVDYWARAVDQATDQNGLKAFKILVAARSDRGGLSVSKERLDEVKQRLGFDTFLETSAKTKHGVESLKKTILNAISWSNLPNITTPDVFARIKEFLKLEKEQGRILAAHEDLFNAYIRIHPEDKEHHQAFATCLQLLEASGLIRKLSFGDLVLLQPEMLDGYCAALAIAARKEPDGLGCIAEQKALRGSFDLDKEHRILDRAMEKSMLLATVEEAVGRGIAVRQPTDEGIMLIFPSELRQDYPEYPDQRALSVAFTFDGPVSAVYAALAVSLMHSVSFGKHRLYKNAAIFYGPRRSECGFIVKYPDRTNDAHGRLEVFFHEGTDKDWRLLFLRYINRQLEKLALKGTVKRDRIYTCSQQGCGFQIPPEAVAKAVSQNRNVVFCPIDMTSISLDDLVEEVAKTDLIVEELESQSEEIREIEKRKATYKHKLEHDEYHTFLCHNSKDKSEVRRLREKLDEWGIVSWLDERGLWGGDVFVPELERIIEKTPTALVIVGQHWMGDWQLQEYYALLDRAVSESKDKNRGLRLIPVLLPGAPKVPKLPVFLSSRQFISFETKDGLDDRDVLRDLVKAILAR